MIYQSRLLFQEILTRLWVKIKLRTSQTVCPVLINLTSHRASQQFSQSHSIQPFCHRSLQEQLHFRRHRSSRNGTCKLRTKTNTWKFLRGSINKEEATWQRMRCSNYLKRRSCRNKTAAKSGTCLTERVSASSTSRCSWSRCTLCTNERKIPIYLYRMICHLN
jgi:hypothetical protein